MGDPGLASEMAAAARQPARAAARPGLGRREQMPRRAGRSASATRPSALAELADLEALTDQLGQGTRAPPWTTSTWRRWSAARAATAADDVARAAPAGARARAAGLPQPRRRTGSSSPRRRCAGWARPRCAGCSRSSTPAGRGEHDVRRRGRGRRARPAPRASGGSATSSRWTSSARSERRRCASARERRQRPPRRARRRGLRGRRDRAADVGGGRAAGRPVVLDGPARAAGAR